MRRPRPAALAAVLLVVGLALVRAEPSPDWQESAEGSVDITVDVELVEVAEATPAPPATPKERADKSLADAAEKLAALQAEVLPGDQATMVPMLAAKHALATCSKYYHDTQSACTTLTSSGAAAGACDQSWTDMAAHCEKMVEHSDPIKVVRDPSLDFNERWTKQKAADKQAADALMANATNSSATFLVAEI